ncbi:RNA polymerase sigma factor [Pelagibius sp. Alg239-R121]|uniref:RNA polymerase sigma factor n=1 Tax=Pelagibius sp. Alg239-R121 TaxID=2993448 RepID=UPI0024A7147A|nr:RNA polymerase sigma factor [Pelagibius sp. Alg239-R121]
MSERTDSFEQALIDLLPRLRRFGCSLTGSLDMADDLVQASCERALTRVHQWIPGTRLDSWVFSIMQSIWHNELRSRKVRRGTGLADTEHLVDISAEGQIESGLLLGDLEKVFARFPEQQRALLMLVCVEGYSYKEASEILEIPIGTVMSRLSRARLTLAEYMSDFLPEAAPGEGLT